MFAPVVAQFLFKLLEIHKTSTVFHQGAPDPTSQLCMSYHWVVSAALRSVGVLFVKSNFDTLYLVAEFDGGAEFQVHALLHSGQSQQQQRLTVNVLHTKRYRANSGFSSI